MRGAETADRTRRRLTVMVEHLIEHTKDHADELADARSGLAEHAVAMRLLDEALADLATAQRSLGAFRECVIASG